MRIRVVFASEEGGYPVEEVEKRKECLRRYASPNVHLDFCFLDAGTGTVYKEGINQTDFDRMVDAAVNKFIEAEEQGFDACTPFGTADLAVESARARVKIPVVGWGKATYHVAALLANRVAVIVYEDSAVLHNQKMIEKYHMDHLVTSVYSIKIPLSQMHQRRIELKEKLIETCKTAITDGAELIYPHGVSMVPLYYDPKEIEKEINVPVLNAMEIGIRMTELMAALRRKQKH